MLATCDVMDILLVSVMMLNDVGARRLDERMTMACVLLSLITSPLSQSHVFAPCTQASICV